MSERTLSTERQHEIGYLLFKESVMRDGIRLDSKGMTKIIGVLRKTNVNQGEALAFMRTLMEEIGSSISK